MHTAICLSGKESIGKLLFAKEFAKTILCISEEKPCKNCKSCLQFESNNNPDFSILSPDGNSIKIDQIREFTKKVYEKPVVSNRKVYIIDDSNLMTKEAQNSLLKTLEEPPEYVTIILVTSNENAMLATIKSRCTKIAFNRLSDEELTQILEKEYQYKNIPEITYKVADGSVKRALSIKDKEEQYTKIYEIFDNVGVGLDQSATPDIIDLLQSKDEIFKNKEDIDEILNYINIIFFEKINQNHKYIECMKAVEDTKERLSKNNNYDMTIDYFLFTIWEELNG